MLGTSETMRPPRYAIFSPSSCGRPSTTSSTPPSRLSLWPVARTTRSASRCSGVSGSPQLSAAARAPLDSGLRRTPPGVKRSMCAVMTRSRPRWRAEKNSSPGAKPVRCSKRGYSGVKCRRSSGKRRAMASTAAAPSLSLAATASGSDALHASCLSLKAFVSHKALRRIHQKMARNMHLPRIFRMPPACTKRVAIVQKDHLG
mmetsp:Transcript_81650/g.219482  ORF Transcript_81650/g.219482 Transcript_81650/m.219482 type:complete len:202 (+) Transcript_81650:375-980(+)